jgi:conjugative relaxase-like TrwC/TraI family protein
LAEGLSPDGRFSLVQNAGAENRQGFWDLTLSVPKSLSVLWAAAPEHLRAQLNETLQGSVFAILDEIERTVGFSRQGKGGVNIVPAALTFAVFQHLSSRAEDPQLHWHCLLINTGIRPDGTTGALHTEPLYEAKLALGHYFRDHLAHALVSRFGLTLEKERVGFHVAGVPKELCHVSSKRRHEIEAELDRSGKHGPVAAKEAAVRTRGKKKHTEMRELLAEWAKTAAEYDFGPDNVREIFKRAKLNSAEKTVKEERSSSRQEAHDASQSNTRDRGGREREAGAGRGEGDGSEHERGRRGRGGAGRDSSKQQEQSPEQKRSQKAFEHELRSATDRIFPEKQIRSRILRMAHAIAKKHKITDREQIEAAVGNLKLPFHGRFLRIERARVFENAPKVNPLHDWRTPRLVLKDRPRRWDKIVWSKPILRLGKLKVELRIQRRKLFPKAPAVNPLSKLSLPALRFGAERPKRVPPTKPPHEIERHH